MINSPVIFYLNTYGVFILYLISLFFIWFVERKKEKALHVLLSGGVAGIAALVIKKITSIPRPYLVEGLAPLAGYFSWSSFPSLHTTLAFALSVTVFLHQKKLGLVLLIISLFIGIGRVYANVHYPVDIIFGAFLGSGIAFLIDHYHLKNYT